MKKDLNMINQNIPSILKSAKNIAIIGISDKPNRASHSIGLYLVRAGYNIFPVNPNLKQVLGLKCFNNLSEIKESIDIVDIFRRPEYVTPIAKEAIQISAKTIWMQAGIINEEAASMALDAGLNVIMDRCIKVEHSLLF
jgi:predicted CoA-binding protein